MIIVIFIAGIEAKMSNGTPNATGLPANDKIELIKKYQLVPLIFIIVIGFFANSVVLIYGIHKRNMIKHYSNYFVLSMAVADWLIIFTIPFHLFEYLEGYHGVHNAFCTYIIPIRETFQGVVILSISTLAIMRVRQVTTYPLKQFSKRSCQIIVVAIWIVSFFICTVPFYDGVYVFQEGGVCDPDYPSRLRMRVHVTLLVCLLLSPMLIATIAYLTVIRRISQVLGRDSENEHSCNNKRITYLLIALIASSWITFGVVSIHHLIILYAPQHLNELLWHIGVPLFLGGSALNPVLVILTMPEYRPCNDVQFRCLRKPRVADEVNELRRNKIVSSSV